MPCFSAFADVQPLITCCSTSMLIGLDHLVVAVAQQLSPHPSCKPATSSRCWRSFVHVRTSCRTCIPSGSVAAGRAQAPRVVDVTCRWHDGVITVSAERKISARTGAYSNLPSSNDKLPTSDSNQVDGKGEIVGGPYSKSHARLHSPGETSTDPKTSLFALNTSATPSHVSDLEWIDQHPQSMYTLVGAYPMQ